MIEPQFRRSGTLWYVGDGLIWDQHPPARRRQPGRPLECSCRLYVYNPGHRTAKGVARFYHPDRPPTEARLSVPAGRLTILEVSALPGVPHNQSFWLAVESDAPVFPQMVHEDYTGWDPVPDALVSIAPYPGPLEDERRWVFPDCYQSDPTQGWFERETLTILNPGTRPAAVRVRYLLRNREPGAEEEVRVPPGRVAQLDVWRRTPRLLGQPDGPPVHVVGDYAVRLDSDAPVVAQTTRRARWVGNPAVVGARSTMGVPLRGRGRRLWYYPGGGVWDRGILPRARPSDHPLHQCDNTWNLLFINNVSETSAADATIHFHAPDGSRTSVSELAVPPLRSALCCLHGAPYLGRNVSVDSPFALSVESEGWVVPEMTCAEFEMWSQVCPGAMSAVNFHPGPLREEQTWWLGVGIAGGSDERQTEWTQSYHLFNPGPGPARVELSFLGLGEHGPQAPREVLLAPGAVACVELGEADGLPGHRPFVVRATADRPFCAQAFTRAFTRGLPHTRAMFSIMGVAMDLGG